MPIPGAGSQKINASLFLGGPQLTVRTVEQLTGIHFDAYALHAMFAALQVAGTLAFVPGPEYRFRPESEERA